MQLFTLGHSAHRLEKFLALLGQYGIRTLVDVRSVPASRYHPQYNKLTLEHTLGEQGIRYVFAGRELGGRPSDPACYPGGKLPVKGQANPPRPDYAEMMKRDWFVQGIESLLSLAAEQPTAILCSEEDPAHCHRQHLIVAYLQQHHPQVEILHIRGNGTIMEPESRLL
jgi:uncharacterized protein (DUF488 family)